jgi:undecaprenyl-phosphate alpha-N-acetylglucosaminyl 1-phosphatetransferase
MLSYAVFASALVMALLVIRASIPLAERLDIVDRPSGHKQHKVPVPYVGGFGVVIALSLYLAFAAHQQLAAPLVLASLAVCGGSMFLVGLADDRWQLSFRLRLVIQAGAALVMIFGGGVLLSDLGDILLPGMPILLGLLAVPVTIFGVLSVTNALNMIDGVDGLSGSLALVSFGLLAFLALSGGATADGLLALALAGGVLGFLVFNFRCCLQRSARVYLGDNGSMLVGFMLAWLFIDLSQGDNAVMRPVTALYLFSVPLFDSAMAIIRRVWMGKSPFRPDRTHLHHILLDAGASVETTVWLIAGLHFFVGLVGIAALHAGLADAGLFVIFLGFFLVYGYVISRPWRFVPRMRRLLIRLGITLEHGTGVFIGRFDESQLPVVAERVRQALPRRAKVRAFAERMPGAERETVFMVVDLGSWYAVRPTINALRKSLSMVGAFEIRQYVMRKAENDCRHADWPVKRERRRRERRGSTHVHELLDYRILPRPPSSIEQRPIAA